MPTTRLKQLLEEWTTVQQETRNRWAEQSSHAQRAKDLRAAVDEGQEEIQRLLDAMITAETQSHHFYYEARIEREKKRLMRAEADLLTCMRLEYEEKEKAFKSRARGAYRHEQQREQRRESKPEPKPAPKPKVRVDNEFAAIKAWRTAVDAAFADYASMSVFPEPPAIGFCKKALCSQGERKLEACECQIEQAFRKAKVVLKTERLCWHPDRFSEHPEMVAKAEAVFKVANRMYDMEKR